TSDSDGTGLPDEALAYAREVGRVDFFSLTEHSHYMLPERYFRQIKNAEKFNEPGKFAALYGWEMTWNNKTGYWGHMNILNTKWIENDIHSCGLPEIYERLKRDPNAVAMFNHPGLPWGNFFDFSYRSPEVDRIVCLAEMKGAEYDREYMNLLALGWHASPAFNEDNHNPNWTTGSSSTTYVLAPALTRENIIDAFRRRRTYSTCDPTMKVLFKINGEVMGARLRDPDRLDVDVRIETEAEKGIGNIELVAEDNIVVASVNAGALRKYHWKLTLDPLFDYYYVRITGKGRYTVTAPVWIKGEQPLSVKKLTWSRGDNDYKPNMVTAKIKNSGIKNIKKLRVDFYLVPGSGFDINTTAPYATVKLSGLAAGRVVNVLCRFPDL
ncbi:MAG TPA: CehA/McbA family metallohydrolase, partial [Bacillota bacterium]|nr:CehA/McbA family metallohydrolase [Bacillota bacterium]